MRYRCRLPRCCPLGHDMGDILLKEAALRLNSCVREADTVARMGGDEFTVILGELDDIGSVERIAQEILNKFSQPFQMGNEISTFPPASASRFTPQMQPR